MNRMIDRMKKISKLITPNSMLFKLIVFSIIIVLCGTVLMTVTGNIIYSNSIMQHSFENTFEMQNQVQKAIDLKIGSIQKALTILDKEDVIQNYLKVDYQKQPGERLEYEVAVRELLRLYSETNEDFLNIVVTSEKDHYLSNDSYRIQRRSLKIETWYREAVEAEGDAVIVSSSVGRNLRSGRHYSTNSFVSIAQAIRDNETGEIIGVVLVDLDLETIKNLIKDITFGQTGFVCIMTQDGEVLYSPENEVIYRIRPEWFTDTKAHNFRSKIAGHEYNVIYNQSDYTKLIVVGIYDMEKAIEGVSSIKYISTTIAVLVTIFAMIWALIFSVSITKPLSNLSAVMQKTQRGDLTQRFDNKYKGEVYQLGETYNAMIDRISALINMVYQEQKDKRKVEMQILQEQIKPHFLYNTLDTIQWMARTYKAEDIVEIVQSLSCFFRISLSKGKEFITLQDEITLLKSYLDIQKTRYEDLFVYEVICAPEFSNCMVIKLILQPLIENALYHGVKEMEEGEGMIRVIVSREEQDTLKIIVEDNGAGMNAKW